LVVLVVLVMLAVAPRAQATIPVPDVGSPCSSSTNCLSIQNTGTGNGISGTATSNNGIQGTSTAAAGVGVYGAGNTASATGVCGTSTNANGVFGATNGGFAGVYAVSGIVGDLPQSSSIFSTAVYGTGRIGVSGIAYDDGFAVFGSVGSATAQAIVGACTGACAGSQNANAGVFAGNVLVQGGGAAPLGLRITTGTAYKPGGGLWAATSDRRVKKDVRPFDLGLRELGRVRPVSFRYNGLGGTEDDGKEHVGVIAQDLARVVPFMVTAKRARLRPGDAADTDIEQVEGTAFTYMLINAIQQQHKVIQQQDARIATLERGSRPVAATMFSPLVGAGLTFDAIVLAVFVWLRRKQARKGGSP
jgi:hypothetical protein